MARRRLLAALLLGALPVAALLPALGGGRGAGSQADEAPGAERIIEVASPPARALEFEQGVLDAVARVRRHSVSVVNLRKDGQGRTRPAGLGSGVLVERLGRLYVVTNVHVVAGAQALTILTHDGARHDMTVHDQIARYDFALLRFIDKPAGLQGVRVSAEVSTALDEGAWVLATGNPLGLALDGRPVCTLGVISGTDRVIGGEYFYGNAIQHDAEINPGNSGGPLWNVRGDLIGINGKISSVRDVPGADVTSRGVSFSIPIHQVAAFLTQLVREGDARPGYLGLDVETATDQDGNPVGARVTNVSQRSPVRSGDGTTAVSVGDVITDMTLGAKSTKVRTAPDLINALVLHAADTKVTLRFRRGGRATTWSGRLGSDQ